LTEGIDEIVFIQAAGLGFKETAITAGQVMRNKKLKKEMRTWLN